MVGYVHGSICDSSVSNNHRNAIPCGVDVSSKTSVEVTADKTDAIASSRGSPVQPLPPVLGDSVGAVGSGFSVTGAIGGNNVGIGVGSPPPFGAGVGSVGVVGSPPPPFGAELDQSVLLDLLLHWVHLLVNHHHLMVMAWTLKNPILILIEKSKSLLPDAESFFVRFLSVLCTFDALSAFEDLSFLVLFDDAFVGLSSSFVAFWP